MTEAEPVTVAGPLSDRLIGNARRAYERCIEERLSGNVYVTDDNNFSRYAPDAVILSLAVLEAPIGEVALNPVALRLRGTDAAVGAMEQLDIRLKYLLVPLVLWGRTFGRSRQPFQDFDCLVRMRNDLIHYKMHFFPLGKGPKYVGHLATKKLLLQRPGPSGRFVWVDNLCCAKVALWAHNTACRMAKHLMTMADDVTKAVWGNPAAAFEEIPATYWRTIVRGQP